MSTRPRIYTDDPDPTWTATVTAKDPDETLDWASPKVAVADSDYTTDVTWLGDPGPVRKIAVPMAGIAALGRGLYAVYLQIPGGSDRHVGEVEVAVRT